jgi:leucyl/phenylalanyl-tRNA---protein transferase
MSNISWLGAQDPFPNPLLVDDPDASVPGLIAVSQHIYPDQLEAAYKLGIFPWYSDNQPVLWWSPDPRMVLRANAFKCSHSLQKTIRQFLADDSKELLVDDNFGAVLRSCATIGRKNQDGTWITHEIASAYEGLFNRGHAHSIAIIDNGHLIGGLYCVSFGGMVYGESMFSRKPNASKIALAALCAWCNLNQVQIIDCQQETEHLKSLGASPISRHDFLKHVQATVNQTNIARIWNFNKDILRFWL